MSTLRFAAAAMLVATSGAGLVLLAPPSARADIISDQCINAGTGALIHSEFCTCRMRWNATDHVWYTTRSGAAACIDRKAITGSISPTQKLGPGGEGAGGGGLPGGGGSPGGGVVTGGGAGPGGGGVVTGGGAGPGGDNGGDDGGGPPDGSGNPGNFADVGHAGENPPAGHTADTWGDTEARGKIH